MLCCVIGLDGLDRRCDGRNRRDSAPLFSTAGATLEHRNQWYIADDDDDDDTDDAPVARRLAELIKSSEDDLLVNARVVIDASAEDAGAAAIYWAILALSNS